MPNKSEDDSEMMIMCVFVCIVHTSEWLWHFVSTIRVLASRHFRKIDNYPQKILAQLDLMVAANFTPLFYLFAIIHEQFQRYLLAARNKVCFSFW